LASARLLEAAGDLSAAFATAYDAARKSLAAMLAAQGLRARGGEGGHRVLGEVIQAQLPSHKRDLREFDWMRLRRNDVEYPEPDRPRTTSAEVIAGIDAAQRIVAVGELVVPIVGLGQ
jgi:hypothetical protein